MALEASGMMAMLFAFGLASNCTGGETVPATMGSVGLAIRVSTTSLDSVDFQISGNGINPIKGTIAVAQSGATISSLVAAVPAASGYRADLRGSSPDGQTICQGSSTFDVRKNQTTSIIVLMLCRGPADSGSVGVGGRIDNCPNLTSVAVNPVSVPLGDIITVDATATDPDAGDVLAFAWTASAGTFARATSARTTFTCSSPGSQDLTVVVSDGNCIDSVVIGVTCVQPRCGNGIIEAGEQCDPPGSASCGASCQRMITCGNGVVEQSEQCDPPNGITCNATCRSIGAGGGRGGGGASGNAGASGVGGRVAVAGGTAGTGGFNGVGGNTSRGDAGSLGSGGRDSSEPPSGNDNTDGGTDVAPDGTTSANGKD